MSEKISIKKQILVDAPAERCFRVFTANMGAWWPKDHHIGKSELKECVIEPKVGGRWYEVDEDGGSCDWGKVLAWDPPKRLVLAWQLNAEYAFDPSFVTEVEVRFTAIDARRTQVDFEHRDIERFGEHAAKQNESMNRGWGTILDLFAKNAAG